MPASVIDEPFGLRCVFSDGSTAEFDFAGLPNPGLTRDLALGLVELIHPHGSADTANTVSLYAGALRKMVRRLAEQGFTGGVAELRRPQLAEFWMAGPRRLEAFTRSLVEGWARSGGSLADGVLELATGRHFHIQSYRRPMPPYSESEWQLLTMTCRRVIDDAYGEHRRALAATAQTGDPAGQGGTWEGFCRLLARLGPVRTRTAEDTTGLTRREFHSLRPEYFAAVQAMFPHLDVIIAYRLLFGIYSGIVPDGIADLGLADIDWAGDSTVLLSYVKRRTAAESVNLPRPAIRLLEQWLSHSALLRSWVEPADRDRLWLGLSYIGQPTLISDRDGFRMQVWSRRYGLLGEDGEPVKVQRTRIRTTHHAMREKKNWTGNARATIDPNHTPSVEGDYYLSATTPGQQHAIETVIEDAQHDLLRRAHPPAVIAEEHVAAFAEGYPQLVEAMGLDDHAIVELVGGARDVFTAACGDQLAGLHGPAGKPCPARPWVCLLCPLAVFAPRHAVNLLRLKAFFSRQWQQMPADHFMAVFGPYATRIDQILGRFDAGELAAAASRVADTDDEIPLRPEELSA